MFGVAVMEFDREMLAIQLLSVDHTPLIVCGIPIFAIHFGSVFHEDITICEMAMENALPDVKLYAVVKCCDKPTVAVHCDSIFQMLLIDWDKPIVANQCSSVLHVELIDCIMLTLAIQCGRLLQEADIDWLNPTEVMNPAMRLHMDITDWERLTVTTQ
jgi:hypothetical protein